MNPQKVGITFPPNLPLEGEENSPSPLMGEGRGEGELRNEEVKKA